NFQGFGPIVGAEAVLAGWNGFHLYARATGGVLTGVSKNPYRGTNGLGATVYAGTGDHLRKGVPMVGRGGGGGGGVRDVVNPGRVRDHQLLQPDRPAAVHRRRDPGQVRLADGQPVVRGAVRPGRVDVLTAGVGFARTVRRRPGVPPRAPSLPARRIAIRARRG